MTKQVGSAGSKEFTQELDALTVVLSALGPLEADKRAFVFRTAAERLQISGVVQNGKVPGHPTPTVEGNNGTPDQGLEGVSPKEFLRRKKPISELQRIVCLAYYLANARNQPHFKTSDLTALNTEGAGSNFSNASKTVGNATLQSRFLAPAGKGGSKQITPHGEDYVRALPDQEAAKAVVAAHKSPRRKGKKGGTKKE
jgi:hypothetical protein